MFLHVYQLRDSGKFLSSGFDGVTAQADTVLAAETVSRDALMVQPGSHTALHLTIAPETRLLGVVAEYRDLPNSQWRATSPAPDGGLVTLFKKQTLAIQLGSRSVAVSTTVIRKGH